MTVNGQSRAADVEPRLLLVHFLRENLGLTGTKIGCDTSQCGSCVVRMNGSTVKSCTALAVQADGADITTIEGIAADGELHAVQEAFWNKHGLQCGYCTAGMIMTVTSSCWSATPTPRRRKSAPGWRATSAAAPATTTSSRQSSPPPRPREARRCDMSF